jgi:hypothetical protein
MKANRLRRSSGAYAASGMLNRIVKQRQFLSQPYHPVIPQKMVL